MQPLSIPDWLARLSSLRELDISSDTIETIPDSIFRLPSLTKISIYCAKLTALPENIGNLSKLQEIRLRQCVELESLPESIGNIISLRRLELENTNIKNIPVSIGNLVNLEFLGVSSNPYDKTVKRTPFAVLPTEVSKLVSLQFLKLNKSEITCLPDYLGDLPALKKIEIIDCDINTIPPSIQRLVDNRELILIKNIQEYNEWERTHCPGRNKPRRRKN